MAEYDSILAAANAMPVDDRLRMIDDLASALPDDQPPLLSIAWLEEIDHRSREIDAGTVDMESWDTIRDRLFAGAGLKSAD